MKTKILLFISFLLLSNLISAKTWVIANAGFTFSPVTLTINLGDSVMFDLSSSHDALEVSEATWLANGNTALAGGFSTPFGGGLVLPESLTEGTHFYVCVPHAAGGMKGKIIVQNTTGVIVNLLNSNVTIFPNPSRDVINVKVNNTFAGSVYSLTDQTGRVILEGRLEKETSLVNLTDVTSGIYHFQLSGIKGQSITVVKY